MNITIYVSSYSYGGQENSNALQIEKTPAIKKKTSLNFTTHMLQMLITQQKKKCTAHRKNKTNRLQIKKTTFVNLTTHAANAHNTTNKKKRTANKMYLVVLWAFAPPTVKLMKDVFLICWWFFYLHVFSEVAARWVLSATVYSTIINMYMPVWRGQHEKRMCRHTYCTETAHPVVTLIWYVYGGLYKKHVKGCVEENWEVTIRK